MMKGIKNTILIMLLALPLVGAAVADEQQSKFDRSVGDFSEILPVDANSNDHAIQVEYLLDTDGRPYIISIFSEDPKLTRMILQQMGGNDYLSLGNTGTLAITFYYENIR